MSIENKNDFILAVTLSSIWFVLGIVLLFTNWWIMGIVLLGCGIFSAINPAKHYIASRRTIPNDSIENLELDDSKNN